MSCLLAWTLVLAPCFFFSPFLGCFYFHKVWQGFINNLIFPTKLEPMVLWLFFPSKNQNQGLSTKSKNTGPHQAVTRPHRFHTFKFLWSQPSFLSLSGVRRVCIELGSKQGRQWNDPRKSTKFCNGFLHWRRLFTLLEFAVPSTHPTILMTDRLDSERVSKIDLFQYKISLFRNKT